MTKTLFRVICLSAEGARSLSNPSMGLQLDKLYDVVADVHAATTERCPNGDSSGYLVRDADTGTVLPQIYRRDRFAREGQVVQQRAYSDMAGTTASAPSNPFPTMADADQADRPKAGDTVVCIDAVGARSFSKPETMLEQDEEYVIVADVNDATTVRKPDGGASGFMVKLAQTGEYLAGVWARRRFTKA